MFATARPPRPVHVDPDLMAELVQATGMAANEIIDVEEHPRGHLVTTHDGGRLIVLAEGQEDALGQRGCLLYASPPGGKVPKGARVFADPDDPSAREQVANEAWSLGDLEVAASKVREAPTAVGGRGGPSLLRWVGGDPIRALVAWDHIAKRHDGNRKAAAIRDADAAGCRQIILESGWLSPAAARKL